GIVNTYFPGTNSPTAGSNSIVLGASTGASTPISVGDLVLIIQIQGADINSTNNNNYGGNNGNGAGAVNTNFSAGLYEYAIATSNVPVGGGTLTVRGSGAGNGLVNGYFNANAGAQGQRRFEVIRVPQYSSVTLGGLVTAPAWNGTTGG